jgi:peptidoglycan hydrolase CwlO-like protein
MDPTMTALIVAVTSLVANLAILVKVVTDKIKLTNDRAATAAQRDKDSQDLHDAVLKHGFQIQQLKDQQALTSTVVDDLRDTCATLNTNIVKLDLNVANLADVIKELKNVRTN